MDDKDNKRGFSGLSDLASDVSSSDDVSNPATSSQPPKPPQYEHRPSIDGETEIADDILYNLCPQYEHRPSIDDETGRRVSRSFGPIRDLSILLQRLLNDVPPGVQRVGWKWILGIIAVIFVIWLINYSGDQDSGKRSNSPPPTAPRSYDNRPSRSTLAQKIKDGKARAQQMEAEIQDMDARLQEYQNRLRLYRDSDMVDEHNMLVPQFNSLVSERNDLYEEYKSLVDEVNAKVTLYNSLRR